MKEPQRNGRKWKVDFEKENDPFFINILLQRNYSEKQNYFGRNRQEITFTLHFFIRSSERLVTRSWKHAH